MGLKNRRAQVPFVVVVVGGGFQLSKGRKIQTFKNLLNVFQCRETRAHGVTLKTLKIHRLSSQMPTFLIRGNTRVIVEKG